MGILINQVRNMEILLSEIRTDQKLTTERILTLPCHAREERIKVLEREMDRVQRTVVWRTWESRSLGALTAVVAAVAAAFASAFIHP